jgi:predicted RNase H-like HicB family nuclease
MKDVKKAKTKIYDFPVIVEQDEGGWYFVYVPTLQGCFTQAKSIPEALKNIQEVIELHLEDRKETLKRYVPSRVVSITSLRIAA